MVYKRSGFYRRYKKYRKKGSGVGGYATASKALTLAKRVYSMVDPERKYIDTDISQTIDSTGFVQCLVQLGQGDTAEQRTGNSIKLESLVFKGALSFDTGTTSNNTFFRLIVLIDTSHQGVAPAITDVLDSSSTTSLLNLNNRGRFVILYDKLFTLNDYRLSRQFQYYKKLNLHVRYSGTTNTVASVGKNAIYMIGFSTIPGGLYPPSIVVRPRIKFYDN